MFEVTIRSKILNATDPKIKIIYTKRYYLIEVRVNFFLVKTDEVKKAYIWPRHALWGVDSLCKMSYNYIWVMYFTIWFSSSEFINYAFIWTKVKVWLQLLIERFWNYPAGILMTRNQRPLAFSSKLWLAKTWGYVSPPGPE